MGATLIDRPSTALTQADIATAGDLRYPSVNTAQSFTAGQQAQGRSNIGAAPAITSITASLGADVALNNIANYFDGPSIAQGTSGTWWVSGTVTLIDSAGAATYDAKLWDGTTVIASSEATGPNANNRVSISLSGLITSPAANLRISVKDLSSTSGNIKFNLTGNSKDSTITAIRIA